MAAKTRRLNWRGRLRWLQPRRRHEQRCDRTERCSAASVRRPGFLSTHSQIHSVKYHETVEGNNEKNMEKIRPASAFVSFLGFIQCRLHARLKLYTYSARLVQSPLIL